ncbi:MAG: hypothetical protein IPJ65_25930 [Archangiaceae bacterium]|nr:hypothetical protein [Archangiaceae bacterium]
MLIASSAFAQGAKTRLFILMDNSNSMHETAAGLDKPNPDGSYDLDPNWLTDGGTTSDGGTLLTCNLPALQDAGLCFSKFCSAKCVLYNAMDNYEEDFEFGFATYNTYKRKVDFSLGSSACQYDILAAPNENLPGGTNNRFWSIRNNLAPSCAITRSTTAATPGVRNDTTLTSSRFVCDTNPGVAGADPAKKCASVATPASAWYLAALSAPATMFDIVRSDVTTPAGGGVGATTSTVKNTCTGSSGTYACASTTSAAIFPGAGGANEPTQSPFNGYTYYLRSVVDWPSTVPTLDTFYSRPGTANCIAAAEVLGNTVTTTGGPPNAGYSTALNQLQAGTYAGEPANSACGATRPCTWTLINKQMVSTGNTVNNSTCNSNALPPGVPAYATNGTSTTTRNVGTYYTNPPASCPGTSLACPAQSGTCNGAPANCAVPAGSAVGNGTDTFAQVSFAATAPAPPAGFTTGSASLVHTWKDTGSTVSNVGQCSATRSFGGVGPGGQGCGASYTGQCVYINPVYVPVPGDSTKGYCQYSLYQRSFTRPIYTCKYTFTQYRFQQTVPNPTVLQCSWKLRQLVWRPQLYQYDWTTVGGEVVGNTSVTFDPVNKVCGTSPVAFPAVSPAQCPAKLDSSNATAPAACKLAGRECRLRWWAAPTGAPAIYANAAYKFGRNSRYSNTATVSTEVSNYGSSPPYCQTIDYQDAPFASQVDLASKPFGVQQSVAAASWCTGTGSGGPSSDTLVMGDPYSPGSPNVPLNGSWFGTYRGGTITDTDGDGRSVLYSIDPTGASWQPAPIRSEKDVGWSRLPDGTPMLGLFHDFDPLGLPVLRNLILNLPMHDDPLQMNFQSGTKQWLNGANTPLYGSLSDFQSYLRDTLDTSGSLGPDNLAICRNYGMVLLTDGDENQPPRQPNHPQNTGAGLCDPYTAANCQVFPDYNVGTQLEDIVGTIGSTTGGSAARTPKAVKSYMVSYGNGATSDLLDRMARRAGTAIDPVTGNTNNVTGQAYKPQTADDLRAAFQAIAQSFGNLRVSRSKPTVVRDATGSMIYTGSYQYDSAAGAREWYGYLDAYDVSTLGPGIQNAIWNFDTKLYAMASNARRIYTYLPGVGAQVDLNGVLSAAQKDELKGQMGLAAGGGSDPQLTAILNTVLNPSPTPGAPFSVGLQRRKQRLAAIVHSTPAVVGPPRGIATWPGDPAEQPAYAAYKTALATRETRVFNSSNDGIMHAICEPTDGVAPLCNGLGGRGTEVYGFVPPAIHNRFDDLHTDMVNEYTADGSFGAGDVCFSNCAPMAGFGGWFTMLIGSMNRGDSSLYALDVSNANTPLYKWTMTSAQTGGLLGQTWSPPAVARVTVDMPPLQGGPGAKRWVGLVGAGFKRGDNWGTVSNGFMVVDLETGAPLIDSNPAGVGACTNAYGVSISPCNTARYRVDHNAFACDSKVPGAPVGPLCTRYRNSVAARVAVASQTGAMAQAAYFGDVQGRVQVSRLDTPKAADWQPQQLFDPTDSACAADINGNAQTPIYDAADTVMSSRVDQLPLAEDNENGSYAGTREVRSIYQRALLEKMTNGLTWAFVGTGTDARANEDDTYDYLYAIEDGKNTGATCVGRPAWVKRFPLGEKVLSEMASQAGVLFVSTFLPQNSDPCSNLGDTVLYAFYEQTGKPAFVFDNAGNPPTNRVVVTGTGIPSDTTVIPTSGSTVNILVRKEDPQHRFDVQGASGLVQPGRIKSWRRVR